MSGWNGWTNEVGSGQTEIDKVVAGSSGGDLIRSGNLLTVERETGLSLAGVERERILRIGICRKSQPDQFCSFAPVYRLVRSKSRAKGSGAMKGGDEGEMDD